jgi:hypothetical protein
MDQIAQWIDVKVEQHEVGAVSDRDAPPHHLHSTKRCCAAFFVVCSSLSTVVNAGTIVLISRNGSTLRAHPSEPRSDFPGALRPRLEHAIKPDTDPGLEKWLSLNAEYAKIWPLITLKK